MADEMQKGSLAFDLKRYWASSKKPSSVLGVRAKKEVAATHKEKDMPVLLGMLNMLSEGEQKSPPVETAFVPELQVPTISCTLRAMAGVARVARRGRASMVNRGCFGNKDRGRKAGSTQSEGDVSGTWLGRVNNKNGSS